ncbi:hypothetical protein KC340_g14504 [Hortaea werneckii]|nr:hypothetical protein KC342_g15132 [Hortaea werneckii]KAI7207007.1 hypothetical protein KC365_g16805 [Hortaea werneckii]KAI7298141.1 hypothetical protein KC340_g14504 [Hortaea werneckii]KAI7373470.1 hypothetical protein KC328_g16606 [Hortaea werneckii]
MTSLDQYRPPGRSNRSGRNADNDVFEGLPVKQWGLQPSRISLAPPVSEIADGKEDKWGEPPMPRDSSLLQPWTQQLLRLARSGKVGTSKRKASSDAFEIDEERAEAEEAAAEEAKPTLEDRGYVAKKWKPVPESMLEPESKHFEFLAKRRKGLPSMYGPEVSAAPVVPMRKTKVRRTTISVEGGEQVTVVYEVMVPEGQVVEGEVTDPTELVELQAISAVPGAVVEGLGIANDEGVIVAEHLKPSVQAPRRNRPPPKKKGGPGRGKKRVTFTNPDGSTYTAIVPNATKIVPQPGQTVKHVAKGEEALADVAKAKTEAGGDGQPEQIEGQQQGGEGEGEGEEEGSDEGEEGEDDDDDREDGELSDEDAPTAGATPARPASAAPSSAKDAMQEKHEEEESTAVKAKETTEPIEAAVAPGKEAPPPPPPPRDASSSPELPLAQTSHSRQNSLPEKPSAPAEPEAATDGAPNDTEMGEAEPDEKAETEEVKDPEIRHETNGGGEGEEDLLGDLEKHLEG